MQIAFVRNSIGIHVKTLGGVTLTIKSISRNDLDAGHNLQSLRINRRGMSDGRFASVAIALAGEGGYPQQTGKSLSACQTSDF